jgi:YbgC/YbaW family acyl-CoA thioester hydrolase
MNLWWRLLLTLFFSKGRTTVAALGPCTTPFRVCLSDLDVLRHVNNGKYFSMMDVARVDLMRRSGVLAIMNSRGWYPVVVLESASFFRSLKWGERFEIQTEVIGWDAKYFFMRQSFNRAGKTVADAYVKARMLKRSGGAVSTRELFEIVGANESSPPLPDWLRVWSATHEEARGATANSSR